MADESVEERAGRWGSRRFVVALVAGVLLLLVVDLSQPPQSQLSAAVMLGFIRGYQATLSPVAARAGVRCRFEPSCSRYAAGVIEADGALVGGGRAALRLARCGPWTPAGTVDPPPPTPAAPSGDSVRSAPAGDSDPTAPSGAAAQPARSKREATR